jgi:hypothetical protein
LSIPSPEPSYDWTFSYKLSRPVYCKQLVADNTIKFEKDSNNNLTGFKIEVENKTDSDATKINEMKAKKLEKNTNDIVRNGAKGPSSRCRRSP